MGTSRRVRSSFNDTLALGGESPPPPPPPPTGRIHFWISRGIHGAAAVHIVFIVFLRAGVRRVRSAPRALLAQLALAERDRRKKQKRVIIPASVATCILRRAAERRGRRLARQPNAPRLRETIRKAFIIGTSYAKRPKLSRASARKSRSH
jgi:hypothetical protein